MTPPNTTHDDRPATREEIVGAVRDMLMPHLGPWSEEQIAKRINLSVEATRKALIDHQITPLVLHPQMRRRRYSETQVSRLERLLEGATAREQIREANERTKAALLTRRAGA